MSWRTTPVSLFYSNDLLIKILNRCCYLKHVFRYFVLLVLKLCPIQVVILLPLWIKLPMGQLLLFFLCDFSSFFSYVVAILLTKYFSLLLIDRYILAIQQFITHEEHLRYFFWSVAIFWTASEALHYGHNNKKWLKSLKVIPHKSHHFSLFWCMLCPATPEISSSNKNFNSTAHVFRLSFRFLWLWLKE